MLENTCQFSEIAALCCCVPRSRVSSLRLTVFLVDIKTTGSASQSGDGGYQID